MKMLIIALIFGNGIIGAQVFAQMQKLEGSFTTNAWEQKQYQKYYTETLDFKFDLSTKTFSARVVDKKGTVAFSVEGKCSNLDNTEPRFYSSNSTYIKCKGLNKKGHELTFNGIQSFSNDAGICVESKYPLSSPTIFRLAGLGLSRTSAFSNNKACFETKFYNE